MYQPPPPSPPLRRSAPCIAILFSISYVPAKVSEYLHSLTLLNPNTHRKLHQLNTILFKQDFNF